MPVVAAAVDVGATSAHLLIAQVRGQRLLTLVDESVFLGLGHAVDHEGVVPLAVQQGLAANMARYADTARALGAASMIVVGTEPMRRAANAAAVAAAVEAASGVPFHVVTHEEEGCLTLIGALGGRPVTRELLVVDVGGGSSEFVSAGPGRSPSATGVRIGAGRLTARAESSDPPIAGDFEVLLEEARRELDGAPGITPRELVIVGGTASNLVRLVPAAALDRTLTRARLADARRSLAAEPATAVAERYGMNPARVRILPAGAAIVEAILDRYKLTRARVSHAGIREGAVLAGARAGHGWRDRLPALVLGWTTRGPAHPAPRP